MLVEAAVRKRPPRTERPGGPVECRSGLASPLVSQPRCQSRATAPNRTHAHRDRNGCAPTSRRARALAGTHDDPRATGAGAERVGGRRTSHGMRTEQREGRLWIQKKPGVQRRQASRFLARCLTWRQEAANHHEFRLSVQSMADPSHRQGPRRRVSRVAGCDEPSVQNANASHRCRVRVSRATKGRRTFRASSSSRHPLPDDPFALLDLAVT